MSSEPITQPVCARHPDRVTYVLCHRCGRGICTECMIPSPVGFQCPECVRVGQLSVRTVRTFAPRVTYGIMILCLAIQVLGMLGLGTASGWVQELSLFPARIAVFGEYYRMITAVFVHAGWFHIGMNMLMLWVMGKTLEEALGAVRFATLFILAGLGGSLASYWLNDPLTVGIGASGAIFGLFAAMFILGRELRANTQEIITVIGLNLVIGFVVPGIDWRAHVGGLVTGAVVGWMLMPRRPRAVQVLGPVALLVVLGLLTQLRTDELVTALMQTANVVHS